jgi:hypothetical protein
LSCRLAPVVRLVSPVNGNFLNLGGMEVADYIVTVEKVSCDCWLTSFESAGNYDPKFGGEAGANDEGNIF